MEMPMEMENETSRDDHDGGEQKVTRPKPDGFLRELDQETATGRQAFAKLDPELAQAVGFTHFDTGSSVDNTITVLMQRDDLPQLASQTIVRIKSKEDGRSYLGVVVKGPFAEPDAVPPNSTMAVGVVVQGKKLQFTFDYHGRVDVEILGEEVDGSLVPPRYRPRPKSPVFTIDESESARILGLGGDLCLGVVVGYEKTEARIPSSDKSVLPRHTGILGTTGGGKSTTVATMIEGAQAAGIATIQRRLDAARTAAERKARASARKAHESKMKATIEAAVARAKREESRKTDRFREQMTKQNEELRRKLERMTADERGEVAEAEILRALQSAFPGDIVERLGKSRGSADIRHEVREQGRTCGVIVYEVKNVADWKGDYIKQARKSLVLHEAAQAVLVSTAFPSGQKYLMFGSR